MQQLFRNIIQAILAWEAGVYRSRYNGPVIAVTGSVGKTTTKETIGAVLQRATGNNCLVTPKSLNSEFGVPLTLLGYKKEPTSPVGWLLAVVRGLIVAYFGTTPQCMVLEIGADAKGDIAYLARLIRPTHAVITNVSESHTAKLGSLEEVRREKLSLLDFVDPEGYVFLPGDDPTLAKRSVLTGQHKILVRLHHRADYFASTIKVTLEGTEAILHHGNRTQRVKIARYGEHHLLSVLFAAAVADSLNVPREHQVAAFKELRALPGRGMLIAGKKGSYILDESYNAQPTAMAAAIEVLGQLPAKRRVAVLGDMRELADAEAHHRSIGKLVRQHADYVIGVGPQSKAYKPDEWFMTSQEAIPAALRQLRPGAIVLVKGSQNTIRLERLVKGLMLHPEQAAKLLVRQGPEWQNRP